MSWNSVGWYTVWWSRSLFAMSCLALFLPVPRSFGIFYDRVGPGRWIWGNHITAWNLVARCNLPCCGSLHDMAKHLHWLQILCMERVTTNAVRHIAVNSHNDLPHLEWTPGWPTGTACQLLLVIVGWVMRGLQYVVCLGSQICFIDVLAVHMDLKTFWHRQTNMEIYRKRRLIWYMYTHTKPHRLRKDDWRDHVL